MLTSFILQQLGSMLMSVAHVATKGQADVHGLYLHLTPYWCPWAMLPPLPCGCEWPALPPQAMLMFLASAAAKSYDDVWPMLQQWAVLMFMLCAITIDHAEVQSK